MTKLNYLPIFILAITFSCFISCKKPSGELIPPILEGNWFIPACETCCDSKLDLFLDSPGLFKTESTSFSNSKCDFEKKGDVLFDSKDSIIWIGRHELFISNFVESDTDNTTFNFGTGYKAMQIETDKGESGVYYSLIPNI